ncbi:hypothetical protein MIN45_P1316 [Methylomarinovum tepidoasis]|uniref:CRISPR system ring nuclease SSO2081-like domain-containing protein n=1 Tax=Methylomarinovum tepidoasis TaxID=2840183 RepID=A0AAU9CAK3_9GAMM|nr:CRISPR-associated ring nuclease Csm6 [Methylomarinovum sp. IN45]BCX88946.1 hypothetical protein MIN45_P1316 [Methylomarinovum sp. IN45]
MPDPNRPETYPRRILLAVTGLSPQVVTETLYALAVRRRPAFVPTEIVVVTTSAGAEYVRLDLLSEEPGWFHRLRRDYDLPDIAFDGGRIRVIPGPDGRPLEDIRTPADNESAADFLANTVRELSADPDAALHVSIAGGRKTLGYYAGYALSLFGRPQDRLSHVLVSPPFESHPQFFYPTPCQRIVHSLDKRQIPLDCKQAEVTLAEIPFVSLRHGFDERLLHGEVRFCEAVTAARRALAPPRLVIDLAGQRIQAAGRIVPLRPADLALLSVFARRALAEESPLQAPPKGVPDPEWGRLFLAEYRLIRGGELEDRESTERALANGMDGDYFSQRKAKLHRALRKALGPAAGPYLIHDGGARPRRYRLRLPPEAICYQTLDGKPATADRPPPAGHH